MLIQQGGCRNSLFYILMKKSRLKKRDNLQISYFYVAKYTYKFNKFKQTGNVLNYYLQMF